MISWRAERREVPYAHFENELVGEAAGGEPLAKATALFPSQRREAENEKGFVGFGRGGVGNFGAGGPSAPILGPEYRSAELLADKTSRGGATSGRGSSSGTGVSELLPSAGLPDVL